MMTDELAPPALAQHAFYAVFEQLERIGLAGRNKCRMRYVGMTTSPVVRSISRVEALELLRYAENTLDYARVHLDHLPSSEPPSDGLGVGDMVIVAAEECAWRGFIEEVVDDAENGTSYRVRPADHGELELVAASDLRRAE